MYLKKATVYCNVTMRYNDEKLKKKEFYEIVKRLRTFLMNLALFLKINF